MEFTIVYDTLVRAGVECTSAFVPSASEIGLSSTGGWGVRDVLVTCSRGE
jgi:protein DJ-1